MRDRPEGLSIAGSKHCTQFALHGKTTFPCGSLGWRSRAFADFGEKLYFVFLDKADQGLVASVFVGGSPKDHFGEHGSKVQGFPGEVVLKFAAIERIEVRGNDAVAFQPAEAVGEDVGSDVLVGRKELLETAVTAHHHVADDEQGPAISQHFDGSV